MRVLITTALLLILGTAPLASRAADSPFLKAAQLREEVTRAVELFCKLKKKVPRGGFSRDPLPGYSLWRTYF